MKKFIVFVMMICIVVISSTASAEIQRTHLYDQKISVLTQKLQSMGIKIWNVEYLTASGFSGCEARFGDNPNNQLAFIAENADTISAMAIVTQFAAADHPNYPALQQTFELTGATLNIVGLTTEDANKLVQEIKSDFLTAVADKPNITKHHKEFSSYSVQTQRLIVAEIFVEELSHGVGELKICIRACA